MRTTARRSVLVAIIVTSAVSVFILFTFALEGQSATYDGPKKAAIVDQLYDDLPNLHFQKTSREYLESEDYQVDYFTTKDITVDFYKALPSMNYKLIIIRTHSSITPDNDKKPDSADLFTGEKYQQDKYIYEQLSGHVRKSAFFYSSHRVQYDNGTVTLIPVVSESGTYFSVGSKFVNEQMTGKFPDSIIIIGGCTALGNPILADSLMNRGASAIIGWDNLVGSGHNDTVMLAVLRDLLVDKSDIVDTVESAMQKFGPDPDYHGALKYYPKSAASIHLQ